MNVFVKAVDGPIMKQMQNFAENVALNYLLLNKKTLG